MTTENTTASATEPVSPPAPAKHERSRVAFPYGDLDDAILVARTIRERFGTVCEPDQLAAQMGFDESNGTFRMRIAAGRTFGATDVARRQITLTDLGARLADETEDADARTEAFLRVPLYQRLFELYRGRQLPGNKGLESEITRLGVSPKQAARARRAFQRSAEQASFFASGRDRLVRPASSTVDTPAPEQPAEAPAMRSSEAIDIDGLHPMLVGLIKTIPREGEAFPPNRQRQWIEAARVSFALIFGADDDEAAQPQGDSHRNTTETD